MRFGMLVHTGKPEAIKVARRLVEFFQARGEPTLHRYLDSSTPGKTRLRESGLHGTSGRGAGFGGDGTLLSAARLASSFGKPVLGINMGHLGFLTELDADSFQPALEQVIAGNYAVEERMMIEGGFCGLAWRWRVSAPKRRSCDQGYFRSHDSSQHVY